MMLEVGKVPGVLKMLMKSKITFLRFKLRQKNTIFFTNCSRGVNKIKKKFQALNSV